MIVMTSSWAMWWGVRDRTELLPCSILGQLLDYYQEINPGDVKFPRHRFYGVTTAQRNNTQDGKLYAHDAGLPVVGYRSEDCFFKISDLRNSDEGMYRLVRHHHLMTNK